MGMFDYVEFKFPCPACNRPLTGFQTKDTECLLETVRPLQCHGRFYTACQCGMWIEFRRIPSPNFEVWIKKSGIGNDGSAKMVYSVKINEHGSCQIVERTEES